MTMTMAIIDATVAIDSTRVCKCRRQVCSVIRRSLHHQFFAAAPLANWTRAHFDERVAESHLTPPDAILSVCGSWASEDEMTDGKVANEVPSASYYRDQLSLMASVIPPPLSPAAAVAVE